MTPSKTPADSAEQEITVTPEMLEEQEIVARSWADYAKKGLNASPRRSKDWIALVESMALSDDQGDPWESIRPSK